MPVEQLPRGPCYPELLKRIGLDDASVAALHRKMSSDQGIRITIKVLMNHPVT